MDRFNKNLMNAKQSGIRRFNEFAKANGAELFLTLGEPEFDTPDCIKHSAIKAIEANKTHYTLNVGIHDLREKIAQTERANGIKYSADEIILTCGSTEAISVALMTVCNAGEEIIIPQPAFPLYELIANYLGIKVIKFDTSVDGFQIDKEKLQNAVTSNTKMIVINSPNNPSGVSLTKQSMDNIFEVVSGSDMFVLCDDCYSQLVFEKNFTSLASYPMKRNIILSQSFSKPYAMTGWRIGALLADKEIVEHAKKVHQFLTVSAPTFVQHACITALDYQPVMFLETYKRRANFIYDRLVSMGFDVVKPDGTFYIFPSVEKFGMSSQEFCKRLVLEQKVAIIPGDVFGSPNHVRISFCVADQTIEQAMERLQEFVGSLK